MEAPEKAPHKEEGKELIEKPEAYKRLPFIQNKDSSEKLESLEKVPDKEAGKEVIEKPEAEKQLGFLDIRYMRTFSYLLLFFVITFILNIIYCYITKPELFQRISN